MPKKNQPRILKNCLLIRDNIDTGFETISLCSRVLMSCFQQNQQDRLNLKYMC